MSFTCRLFQFSHTRFFLRLLIVLLISLNLLASADDLQQKESGDSISLITERLANDIKQRSYRPKTSDAQVTRHLKNIKPDGSFPDIDYKNNSRTGWSPLNHLRRVLDMSLAFTTKGSTYYHKKNVKNTIIAALDFWYKANPRSNNWWHNEISSPQCMGKILIVLKSANSPLPQELEQNIIARMARSGNPAAQTGANKVDVAIHYMYRACVTNDPVLLKQAVEQIFYPIRYTTSEGIQHDLSYHQHGPQLYIGGYGAVLIDGISSTAMLLHGTEFALAGEQLEIFGKFVRETYLKVIRGGYFSYNVLGRGVTRMGALSQQGFNKTLLKMCVLDPRYETEYKDASFRISGERPAGYNLNAVNTHYYRSDYMVHQRAGYSFDVRTVSNRTARNEQGVGNGEGFKQYFLSDGAMSLSIKGNEYFNIFPVWDWAKIPGVTCPHFSKIPLAKQWICKGSRSFTGGVSDGIYGAMAYDYDDRYQGINSSAKKAWFFFDEEIVCLGCDIKSTASAPLGTTVNQCLQDGPVIASCKGKEQTLNTGTYHYRNQLTWVLHGGFAYYFPKGGNVELKIGAQSGDWHSINTGYSKEPIKMNVFSLWINHGNSPEKGTYEYVILPNKNKPADLQNHPIKNLHIIANEAPIQAVYQSRLDILQIVFWDKAQFSHQGVSIQVDHPCAIMVRNIKNPSKTSFHISDPSQTRDKIEVLFKAPQMESPKMLSVDLSGANHEKGSTKSFVLTDFD